MTGPDTAHIPQSTLPSWFRQPLPDINSIKQLKDILSDRGLTTVCQGARCPNLGRCWGRGVATFMILGHTCTRACRFCAVASGTPNAPDADEPRQIARTVKELGLQYVVITSVTRDDLPDQGAGHFIETVQALKNAVAEITVELLIPDFSGRSDCLQGVACSGAEVIGHNIETVERVFSRVRPQADYRRSLDVLERIKALNPVVMTKSGLMVGLGESRDDVLETLRDLRSVGCDLLTIGQYLPPMRGERHMPVKRFVVPQEFEDYRAEALGMGFRHAFCGPLVRSSYLAEQGYREAK
ncbi:MAG: lipoyl synthase [Candidatus Omnitrophota bacterium]